MYEFTLWYFGQGLFSLIGKMLVTLVLTLIAYAIAAVIVEAVMKAKAGTKTKTNVKRDKLQRVQDDITAICTYLNVGIDRPGGIGMNYIKDDEGRIGELETLGKSRTNLPLKNVSGELQSLSERIDAIAGYLNVDIKEGPDIHQRWCIDNAEGKLSQHNLEISENFNTIRRAQAQIDVLCDALNFSMIDNGEGHSIDYSIEKHGKAKKR